MKVALAYLCVVLVWSTTPLAIKWSNNSLHYMAAVGLRMLIAAIICLCVLGVLRKKLIKRRKDWLAMLAGAAGLYPNMVLVYWSAQYIPSGLISVILGMYPFLVGMFSLIILRENLFNVSRVMALGIALLGLLVIHLEQIQFGGNAIFGVLGMVVSTLFFAGSTVWLKSVGGGVEPLRQLTGTLLIATPFFVLTWFIFEGDIPSEVSTRSVLGVAYLVITGSIIGGLAFYYVLSHCRVSTVSLIPLITPVMALMIGYFIEGEVLSHTSIFGSFLILFSLAIYQGVLKNAHPRVSRSVLKRKIKSPSTV